MLVLIKLLIEAIPWIVFPIPKSSFFSKFIAYQSTQISEAKTLSKWSKIWLRDKKKHNKK